MAHHILADKNMKYSTIINKEYYTTEGCHIIEVMNTAEQENVSIARARVEPGVKTRVHYLIDTSEHYCVQQGRGLVFLDEQAGFEVIPGDIVAIEPGQHQSIENIGNEDLIFLCVCTPRFKQENYVEVG